MLSYHIKSASQRFNPEISHGFSVYKGESALALQAILCTYIWSPINWKNGVRSTSNFVSSDFIGLDFENPDVSLHDIDQHFEDYWRIIGTTRNHQKWKGSEIPRDRFRVLLKWDRTIHLYDEYAYNVENLINQLGADKSCKDGARIFFPCSEIICAETDPSLPPYPVQQFTGTSTKSEKIQKYLERSAFHNSYGRMSSYALRWLCNEIPEGERNPTCHRLGCELLRAGIDYEDAVLRILRSPTYYMKPISPELLKEIRAAVANGYKIAARDLEKDGKGQ